jgi:DNA-binding LacI/PurR family transcriptional regulator
MAFGALRALRQSGLRCPQDVSVVGLDDHELAHTFDLTTVAQPVAELGAAAAGWLMHRLDPREEGGVIEEDAPTRFHEVRLVLRRTTGPPLGTS